MRPLRVAVLDEELPFPLTSGKRIRTFNLLRRLADRHRVTMICHRNPDPAEASQADQAFRSLGVETVVTEARLHVGRKLCQLFIERRGHRERGYTGASRRSVSILATFAAFSGWQGD